MRNSMAVAAAGFALTLLTLPVLGNHALWLALAVFLALRGLSPVSYTHLDVYKRQVACRFWRIYRPNHPHDRNG